MTANEFIWNLLSKNNEVEEANKYLAEMQLCNVRVCNDGFPDARSPCTNPYKVRVKIAGYRQLYQRQHPHFCHQVNISNKASRERVIFEMGYNKALDDVGKNFKRGSLRITSHKQVSDKIANLRKILKDKSN